MTYTLISGAAGFIGSHLVERLLDERFDLIGVDDLRSSPLPLDELVAEIGPQWGRMAFYKEPIEHFARRGSAGYPVSGIYHLASPVGPAGILPYAGRIVQEIVNSTYAVIELALRHKCRLVYVSTSEIYNANGLCDEYTVCQVPISDPTVRMEYSIGKLAGEIAVLNTDGLDSVIIRPFNVAGPRQSRKGGFVLPTWVDQGLAGEPLTVFGDGSAVRAFTHVEDVVDGLIRAMRDGTCGQAYNLGNPLNRTSMLKLAYKVEQELGHITARLRYVDGKTIHGPKYTEAADKWTYAERAQQELGWQPKWTIEDTIRDVIAYERSRMSTRGGQNAV